MSGDDDSDTSVPDPESEPLLDGQPITNSKDTDSGTSERDSED